MTFAEIIPGLLAGREFIRGDGRVLYFGDDDGLREPVVYSNIDDELEWSAFVADDIAATDWEEVE